MNHWMGNGKDDGRTALLVEKQRYVGMEGFESWVQNGLDCRRGRTFNMKCLRAVLGAKVMDRIKSEYRRRM